MEASMAAIIDRIRHEPALLVSLVLILVNLVWGAEHARNLERVVESLAILVNGLVIRSLVTPVSKLPGSRRG